LLFQKTSPALDQATYTLNLPAQADGYAQGLYAALRTLDNWQLDVILIAQPPATFAWQAVNDRLKKATHLV